MSKYQLQVNITSGLLVVNFDSAAELEERIKELKEAQREEKKVTDDETTIANLLAQNKVLRGRLKGEDRAQEPVAFKALLAHVQEVYSMYDSLLDERNRLAAKVSARHENE